MHCSRHNTTSKQHNPAPESWVPKATPRSAQEGYDERLKSRQHQQHPKRTRTTRAPGPLKGPSHRAPGCNQEEWRRIMEGKK